MDLKQSGRSFNFLNYATISSDNVAACSCVNMMEVVLTHS